MMIVEPSRILFLFKIVVTIIVPLIVASNTYFNYVDLKKMKIKRSVFYKNMITDVGITGFLLLFMWLLPVFFNMWL
ncbi:hypothetical protein HMPREF9521_00283 [Enterococcus faecalis TX2134]|uniref:hypothetical protein n=1 Tax=Enterococcus faecalis TaxID=1351 RepID=UPI0001E19CC9|nr:hypothetical protein [Enterococcus faecalis]EFM77763.1 hypothetical protein HMPREF9521_00283 [Enterococcus faecalis TX2134]HAP3325042.1 hypothetical protein [Enterococcus faecalis]